MAFQTSMRIQLGWLLAMSSLAAAMVFLATSSYGPGLSTDGARYISTADNLAAGHGLKDYLGGTLTQWPPLYPSLVAGIYRLTGLNTMDVARWLNILAAGAIVFMGSMLARVGAPQVPGLALLTAFVLTTSPQLLALNANVASDSLFIALTLLSLLALGRALEYGKLFDWVLTLIVIVLACFQRYAGLSLVFVLFLSSLAYWRMGKPRPWLPMLMVILAGAPIFFWGLLHNYPHTGHLFGRHLPAEPLSNLGITLEKIADWFMPQSLFVAIPLWLWLVGAGLLLWKMSTNANWRAVLTNWLTPRALPITFFLIVYSGMLVFSTSTIEHGLPGNDRIHLVLLPSFLVAAGAALGVLLPSVNSNRRQMLIKKGFWLLFGLWLLFPLYRVQKYVRLSVEEGDVSRYNIYATRALLESEFASLLRATPKLQGGILYSNNEGAAWMLLRRQVGPMPGSDPAQLATWLNRNTEGFIVWFEGDLDYKDLLPVDSLATYIQMTPIFTSPGGDLYYFEKYP